MSNYDPDNPSQELIHICSNMARRHLNPIIDWTTEEVWEFIHEYNIPYCKLYDEGWKRLGCIGCPMAGTEGRRKEFKRYPTYEKAYKRAFQRMIDRQVEGGVLQNEGCRNSSTFGWKSKPIYNGEEMFEYWLQDRLGRR